MTRAIKSGFVAAALLLPALAVPYAHAEGACIFGVCLGTRASGSGGGSIPDTPEISPAMLTSGLAILGGSGVILRGRRKKQTN